MRGISSNKSIVCAGLNFIQRSQRENGGFLSFIGIHEDSFETTRPRQTSFFPSLILDALCQVEHSTSTAIKDRIICFLQAQRSASWSYNYWDRTSPEYRTRPYPDDLDDTFCALAALYKADPHLVTGETLAMVANILIATEHVQGGPYRTWLVTEETENSHWHDYDLAVNANIGYFLSLKDIELPNVVRMIETAISANNLTTPYYSDARTVIYFISRWYKGAYVTKLTKILAKDLQNPSQYSPMQAALTVSALMRFGYDSIKLQPLVAYLKAAQLSDGSWPAGQLCNDSIKNGITRYAGTSSLTTALCLEALELYRTRLKTDTPPSIKPQTSRQYKIATSQISHVIDKLNSPELQRILRLIFHRIKQLDRDCQVALLPWMVYDAIGTNANSRVCSQLSAISMWGWMAYTTYDDFLDGDADRSSIPAANFCLRYLSNSLASTLPDNGDFQADALKIMNRLDAANAWELAHCRAIVRSGTLRIAVLPDYSDHWQLADRSLGHTIAGLGVLYAVGFDRDSATFQAYIVFFKHYLIARQLNDDTHDWEEDLAAGHINAAAAMLLSRRNMGTGSKEVVIDLERDLPELRTAMWEEVVVDVCQQIEVHIAAARAALSQPGVQLSITILGSLLLPVEDAVLKTVTTRREALQFIAHL